MVAPTTPRKTNKATTGGIAVEYYCMEEIKYLVVHCSATNPDIDVGVKEIRQWHRVRGFFDIGYHFVIRRNGEIELGRAIDRPGAHAPAVNDCSIAVCLVGGVDKTKKMNPENNFTPKQMDVLRALLERLKVEYPNAEVIGHRDVPGTNKACPSFDMKALWKEWTEA